MRVHVLQHLPFEDLGNIALNLQDRGAQVSHTHFFENGQLPSLDGIDMIIAMGGSMSINDEREFPWLKPEKQFIRDAIRRNISVLGVCLGAQLIAGALGARVYPNPHKEIGWFPIRGIPVPEGFFSFPSECPVFHWHGETFDLPDGAVRLAESDGCRNQAFQIKGNVIGIQFHLETTYANASALVQNFRDELLPLPYVQRESDILGASPALYQNIHSVMNDLLSHLANYTPGKARI
ncbi:MAG TPA: type 1 glutamine amidotransferase [Acidobacteriota bacterium]|nr:type 1 glutamine amidotransferase [Acidobacteriota bacterium]